MTLSRDAHPGDIVVSTQRPQDESAVLIRRKDTDDGWWIRHATSTNPGHTAGLADYVLDDTTNSGWRLITHTELVNYATLRDALTHDESISAAINAVLHGHTGDQT
jgi:hypothetical protein